jgi:hypothetical protein
MIIIIIIIKKIILISNYYITRIIIIIPFKKKKKKIKKIIIEEFPYSTTTATINVYQSGTHSSRGQHSSMQMCAIKWSFDGCFWHS